METLGAETWDAVIAGTSLPQSLLALALSKCDLKVLHVDRNNYYGGLDAGLSLDEAERWIKISQEQHHPNHFSSSRSADVTSLSPSRAYTIGLRPQIIYAKSKFLPNLVSSQIHSQLEFQAVGSLWVYGNAGLRKIPNNREDVFADDTISVRDKRRLMGLLRYVLEEQELSPGVHESNLEEKLESHFKLPKHLHAPVQALTLSTNVLSKIPFEPAINRLKLHLTSMGYFGPGLAAVMAKYGGNSEIAQVACRAGAVGGFVYLLGHGIKSIDSTTDTLASVELSDGTTVKTKHVVGLANDLPEESSSPKSGSIEVAHKISIISKPLRHLFAPASEASPVPAVTIVLMEDETQGKPPIYLQVHSGDTGECPSGQCIIYASCLRDGSTSQERLSSAIDKILSTNEDAEPADILWSMSFVSQERTLNSQQTTSELHKDSSGKILTFPNPMHDLSFDDTVLDSVKAAWEIILDERSAEYDFLRFEQRRDENNEE